MFGKLVGAPPSLLLCSLANSVKKRKTGIVTGMVCKRHKTENKSKVWSETPCVCIRKDSVRRHSQTMQHKDGVEKVSSQGNSSSHLEYCSQPFFLVVEQ